MDKTINKLHKKSISIIVPAFNEEKLIEETLKAIRKGCQLWELSKDGLSGENQVIEIIVVDDGSNDQTCTVAVSWADVIVSHSRSYGKGEALNTGWRLAKGSILVFLDADLGSSAAHFPMMIKPLLDDYADMVIALLPKPVKRGGLGMVRKLAQQGVYRLSGFTSLAPLSGQRAIRRETLERIGRFASGFGVEVGLTIDAVKLGYRVKEWEVPFYHRESGRDLKSWVHRGKQFYAVGQTLLERYRYPIC